MLKKIILAAAGIAVSAPVLADRGWRHDDDDRGRGHYKHHHKHYRHHPRPVFVVPPPVYYVPAPVYHYAPPPHVYYAPPPVYYSPQPQHSGISIRLHFPL